MRDHAITKLGLDEVQAVLGHMAAGPVLLKPVLLSETKKIIENQHETQMSHRIKLRTSAGTKFKSLLPSHEAVTLFQFQTIILYHDYYFDNDDDDYGDNNDND